MKIYSIFNSIDGEVTPYYQGGFSTFVRMAGCNFAGVPCPYCDTKYALMTDSGRSMTVKEIADTIDRLQCRRVTITGGEPFYQREGLMELLHKLIYNSKHDYGVTVETNGSYEIPNLPFVRWIVDYKCPSAGKQAVKAMNNNNFKALIHNDFVKFVIGDKADYEFAKEKLLELEDEGCKATFAMGIHSTEISYNNLIHWLKDDKMYRVIINAQLHKLLNLVEEQ